MPETEEHPCKVIKIETGYGNLYINIMDRDDKPLKIICTIGKSGQSTMAKAMVTGTMVSLALKYGAPIDEIIEKLSGIRGDHPFTGPHGVVWSIPDAVAKALKIYMEGRE